MKVFGKQVQIGDPEQVDIVIFDECNSQYVRRAISQNHSIAVFKMRPHEIIIGLGILRNFLRCFDHFELKDAARHRTGFLRGAFSQLRNIYFEACLLSMKPKAVVTFIDNSSNFHWLSKHCRAFPFIAIQNGSRLRYAITENHGYYLQHYFCWGTHEVNLFGQLGYQVEHYYPVGSLIASLTLEQTPSGATHTEYDLLVVSSWRGNIGFPPDVIDTMRSMKIMDHLLAKYVAGRSMRAAIILRAERDSEHWIMPGVGTEYDYFHDIYGDTVEIIEADFAARTIYPVMLQSEVIVSCLSSALIEAYGLGKKVLYCNFADFNIYHCDIEPMIVTNDRNFEAFSKRLDDLLAQTESNYRDQHQDSMKKYMNFPAGCLTYRAITEGVDKIIKGHQYQTLS